MRLPTVRFRNQDCPIEQLYYGNDRTALKLLCEDGSPMAVATVNPPDDDLPEGHVFIKNWSENEGMLDALVVAGVVEPTGRTVETGWVHADECKLLIEEI